MSRIEPLTLTQLDAELQAIMSAGEDMMGFTPNDGLIMARKPALLKALLGLVQAVYEPGSVPIGLKKLVALMTSSASGCRYCEAHTGFGALRVGVDENKVAAIWEYPTHPLFDAAERAALDLARNAAMVPNAVTDQDFAALREHFTDEQIIELVGVISLFGFLTRWNATLATDLEAEPEDGVQGLIK
ncbi:carboxymuconolactone decarboxylase [Exilibacterium tricleocarpae]|uniref:Carboxymuconolactone decarboxylase n=1 Tax=Exilibacterium tricleocarpae TaxID=2591008 RepID=A0A545TVL2_9GAMM|nr:carboxymuconolactone decarboxylase family protein [Exilibacterium tricleocarpae]TQV81242.1 carboxymuconolactone decarboxylase [Exilibacterium tricleocarpae]